MSKIAKKYGYSSSLQSKTKSAKKLSKEKSKTYNRNHFGNNVRRGYLIREDNNNMIPFQFNPDEWKEPRKAVYTIVDSPGCVYPDVNYIRCDSETIKLTLQFDDACVNMDNYNPCQNKINQLLSLAEPSTRNIVIRGTSRFSAPTICKFVWGDEVKRVVVAEVGAKRTSFDKDLKTLVASVDVEMIVIK